MNALQSMKGVTNNKVTRSGLILNDETSSINGIQFSHADYWNYAGGTKVPSSQTKVQPVESWTNDLFMYTAM
jgi:hypothetical protein